MRPKILLFGAVIVVGIAMIHYSRLNLQTDYNHYAWARALQGLGYAFFFVPLSVISYSQLRPDQNNRASSLTNFFRNWGGSFGVAFITTMSERRQDFHQARTGDNLTASNLNLQQAIHDIALYLQSHGYSAVEATQAATLRVYDQLGAQTHMLAFMDCFRIIGLITLAAAPLVLVTKSITRAAKLPEGH